MAKQPVAKQSYRYVGPVTPLSQGAGKEDRMLYPGTAYTDLNTDDPIVKNLIERELLIAETGTTQPETEGA